MKLISIIALSSAISSATATTTKSHNDVDARAQKVSPAEEAVTKVDSSHPQLPKISNNQRLLESMTTSDLQSSTNQFVNENSSSIKLIKNNAKRDYYTSSSSNNGSESTSGGGRRLVSTSDKVAEVFEKKKEEEHTTDQDHRRTQLRKSRRGFRKGRKKLGNLLGGRGGGGKWGKTDWTNDDWNDDDWGGKSGKSGGGHGGDWGYSRSYGGSWDEWGSGSGKSGKDSEWHSSGDKWGGGKFDFGLSRSKWGDDDGWGNSRSFDFDLDLDFNRRELFYLLPVACPNECVSSYIEDNYELKDSLKECREYEETQLWRIISDRSFIMIESFDNPGKCIGVDYDKGDSELNVAKMCFNGELVLRDCYDADYGAEWYFTGGQLVNSFCWSAGLSSVMTVLFEDKKQLIKECQKDLTVYGAVGEALLKADTFMFVNRLPTSPIDIPDVDDILDGKIPKLTKSSND